MPEFLGRIGYCCRVSEYDPLIRTSEGEGVDDLELVQRRFDVARRPYLRSPVPWLVWAIVLPGAALATLPVQGSFGVPGVLMLWSIAVLVGGLIEGSLIFKRSRGTASSLGRWVMRLQGNQSLIGIALSAFLIWHDLARGIPGLWLLLIGHSFFVIGGLAFRPMRQAGILYQLGGLVALWPGVNPLLVFALATALGNLRIAVALLGESKRAAVELD